MRLRSYAVAIMEALLVFPATLFMVALFARNLQPPQYEPARTAAQIVTWYAERPRIGLWVLLIALPLIVFVAGAAALWRKWSDEIELRHATRQTLAALRVHLTAAITLASTVTAGAILAIVALHLLTD